jgi:hypothetical protein
MISRRCKCPFSNFSHLAKILSIYQQLVPNQSIFALRGAGFVVQWGIKNQELKVRGAFYGAAGWAGRLDGFSRDASVL